MDILKPVRLHSLKTAASLLFKDFKNNAGRGIIAAERLCQVPDFKQRSAEWLMAHASQVQRKHAYTAVAIEHGYANWPDLKRTVVDNDCLYRSSGVAYIHAWFRDYEAAKQYQDRHQGYLLAFWKDFVVCGKEYIDHIGLGAYEAYWKRIGYNWVQPSDKTAWTLLHAQATAIYQSQK